MRLLLLSSALCAALLLQPRVFAQSPGQELSVSRSNRTIAVTATESVTAVADVATVHIGFIAYASDTSSAYAAGSKVSNAVLDALKHANVPPEAIESQSQEVRPVQPFERTSMTDAEKAVRQFEVAQSWTVRTGAEDAARVLDFAVKAGANQSGGIDWSLKDPNTAQAEAAGKALQRARTVADAMGKGLGVTVGPLLFASNTTQGEPVRPLMRGMAGLASKAEIVLPLAINPRQITTTATVYAVFAIE